MNKEKQTINTLLISRKFSKNIPKAINLNPKGE